MEADEEQFGHFQTKKKDGSAPSYNLGMVAGNQQTFAPSIEQQKRKD